MKKMKSVLFIVKIVAITLLFYITRLYPELFGFQPCMTTERPIVQEK